MKKIVQLTLIIASWYFSTAFAQTNLNLETWAPNGFGGEDPTGWGTLNGFMALGAPQTTFKNTTTPGEGLASAKLTSIYFAGATTYNAPADTVGGMLSIGGPPGFGPLGIPYTQKPVSVDFIYKANPLGNDMGVLIVQLQHRDTILDSTIVDGQGLMVFTNQVATWTAGSICITYFTAGTPDTLKIMAASSAIMFGMLPRGIGVPGSELELDGFVINLPGGALSAAITGLTNVNCKGNCTGAVNITPSGTPSYTYSWSNGDTTATADSLCAGIVYSVFVTDGIGDKTCLVAMVSEPATVLTGTVSGTNETATGASDGTATASASGGTGNLSYSWNTIPPQTTDSIGGLAPGNYIVTVTDSLGCTFIDTITVVAFVGINDIVGNINIKVYPVPAVNELNIVTSLGSEGVVRISDLLGKQLTSVAIKNEITRLNTTNFPSGLYLYQITDKNGIVLTKGKFSVAK